MAQGGVSTDTVGPHPNITIVIGQTVVDLSSLLSTVICISFCAYFIGFYQFFVPLSPLL